MVPFARVAELAAWEDLHVLACIRPPTSLPMGKFDEMEKDGVGDLQWLLDQRPMRENPTALLPNARSIVIVAWHYQPDPRCDELRRARFAAGKDYHSILRLKLARVGRALGAAQRACVDSAPIAERSLAYLAGLGWIGRNALLIDPKAGSYRLLGVLLSGAEIEEHGKGQMRDHCGTCHACETACPTGALVDRRVKVERCISYLTIEHKGVIARELAERFGGWWFGCDICQEVCPWNRFAPKADDPRLTGSEAASADLLALTRGQFDVFFAGRPIRRLGWDRFRRNLLVALFSLGRLEECWPIIAEGIPLVMAQARELQLIDADQDDQACTSR